MNSLDQAYGEVRSKICNAYLIALTVTAIPALAASFYRIVNIGWQPVMGLHISMAAALCLISLFRKRISYLIRVGFLLFFFIAIGLAGLWSFGLIAAGATFVVIAPILASIFLSIRSSVTVLAVTVAIASAIGLSIVLGYRSPAIDTAAYATSAPAWILAIITWILTGGSMALAVGILNKTLVKTLNSSQREARAREENESQYSRLLNNLREVVYSYSTKNGGLYYSPYVEEILGYTPDQLIQSPHLWSENVHPDDQASFQKAIADLRIDKHFDLQYRVSDTKGHWHWFHDRSTTILVTDDDLTIDGIATEITAQKQAEEQLRQSQKMEAIGQLTGGIAHDFNNLLSVMMLNSEYLEGEISESDKARPRLDMIKQAVDRASSLTYRLMAFSRQQVLLPTPTDLAKLISGLADLLRRTLGETVRLNVELIPGLWPATIDRHQLENALLNLAINARDAMPNGGTLTIKAANIAVSESYFVQSVEIACGDYVLVEVSDTGAGMSPDIQARIFEPFFTTKDVGQGSGLGLSMVYGFVKQSEGYITVKSSIGQGTTIRLFIPRSAEVAAETGASADAPTTKQPGTERILVVEDDADVRKIPVTILRSQGYEVVEAESGDEAIKCLGDSQPFDLLFTDVVMPGGKNGMELAEEARALQPNLKVLYTSGYAVNVVSANGAPSSDPLAPQELGTDAALLNKPYHRAELLKKVRTVLDDT